MNNNQSDSKLNFNRTAIPRHPLNRPDLNDINRFSEDENSDGNEDYAEPSITKKSSNDKSKVDLDIPDSDLDLQESAANDDGENNYYNNDGENRNNTEENQQ